MATTALSTENFVETVTSDGIHLVDFWADWCGPCKQFAPIFEAASERNPDIVFGKVDTEANQTLAGQLGIQAIPTLMAFRDGVLVHRAPGALPGPALDELIDAVRGLDMEDVHRRIAEHEASDEASNHAAPESERSDAER